MLEQPQMCEKAKGMRRDRIKGVCYVVTRVSSCRLPLSQPPGDLIVRIHFQVIQQFLTGGGGLTRCGRCCCICLPKYI